MTTENQPDKIDEISTCADNIANLLSQALETKVTKTVTTTEDGSRVTVIRATKLDEKSTA